MRALTDFIVNQCKKFGSANLYHFIAPEQNCSRSNRQKLLCCTESRLVPCVRRCCHGRAKDHQAAYLLASAPSVDYRLSFIDGAHASAKMTPQAWAHSDGGRGIGVKNQFAGGYLGDSSSDCFGSDDSVNALWRSRLPMFPSEVDRYFSAVRLGDKRRYQF